MTLPETFTTQPNGLEQRIAEATPTQRTIIVPLFQNGSPIPDYVAKVVNPAAASLTTALYYLNQERDNIGALGPHPRIVRLVYPELVDIPYGSGTLPGIILENVGVNLSQLWSFFEINPDLMHVPYIARQLIEGLEHIEQNGLQWGDLKPDNVSALPDQEGDLQFSLIDFEGLVTFPLNGAQVPLFTLPYASPEMIYSRLAFMFGRDQCAGRVLQNFGRDFGLPAEHLTLSEVYKWTCNLNELLSRQTPHTFHQHGLALLLYKLFAPERTHFFTGEVGCTSAHLYPDQELIYDERIGPIFPSLKRATLFQPDQRYSNLRAFLHDLEVATELIP